MLKILDKNKNIYNLELIYETELNEMELQEIFNLGIYLKKNT